VKSHPVSCIGVRQHNFNLKKPRRNSGFRPGAGVRIFGQHTTSFLPFTISEVAFLKISSLKVYESFVHQVEVKVFSFFPDYLFSFIDLFLAEIFKSHSFCHSDNSFPSTRRPVLEGLQILTLHVIETLKSVINFGGPLFQKK